MKLYDVSSVGTDQMLTLCIENLFWEGMLSAPHPYTPHPYNPHPTHPPPPTSFLA